jgi:hypothetical protein
MPKTSGVSVLADFFKTIKETEVKKSGEETPTLWTPGEKKRFVLQGLILSFNSTAGYWELFDGTTLIFGFNAKAVSATEVPLQITLPVGYESIAVENKLILKTSATSAKVSLVVYGTEAA